MMKWMQENEFEELTMAELLRIEGGGGCSAAELKTETIRGMIRGAITGLVTGTVQGVIIGGLVGGAVEAGDYTYSCGRK